MIEAVIFDLDGTLIRLPIDYEKLFQEFSKIMKINDIHPMTKTISRLDERTKDRIFRVWDKAELDVLNDIAVNTEGMTLYKEFSEKPKALVTMQGKKLTQNVFKTLKLSFKLVITREDSLDRVEQLKTALQRLGIDSQNALFVGNTEKDSAAAKDVRCQFMRVGE